MQSVEEHQEIPMEEAVVKPVKGRKKRRRARKPAAGRRREPNDLTRGIVNPGRSWLPPARRLPAMQQWYGAKETSLEKL
jgi:hypothetical protein